MKVSIKFDGNDTKQVTEAVTKVVAALKGVTLEGALTFIEELASDLLGDLPADGATSDDAKDKTATSGEDVSHREDDIHEVQRYLSSRGRYIGAIIDDEVSAQTLTALKSAGIVSVKELSEYSLKQLMRIEGMDREGIIECRALLARQNLTLRGDEA